MTLIRNVINADFLVPTFPWPPVGDYMFNIARDKSIYSNPPGTDLNKAVDGNMDTEAYTGNGSMPFISVDLRSQHEIEEVHILIRPAGKLNRVEMPFVTYVHHKNYYSSCI